MLLWFGSWKNALSSYPPDWVKKDYKRFPRIQVQDGKTIELLSTLSDANRDADARAFAALMRHVKEVDGQQHTVLMIQVENEVNVIGDSRDRSPVANKAFAGPVPKELMDYLQKHKDALISEFRQVWETAGFKTSGTWEEVFGKGIATDQAFMAWNYARYIGRVAEAGKAEYPIPMYVNAAVMAFARVGPPESAHSGGPLAQLGDIWRAGGPQIDILSPDIYGNDDFFMSTTASFARNGNPLFIPETSGRAGRRDQGALRLRTPQRHRLLAFRHRRVQSARHRPDRRLRPHCAIGAPDSGAPGQRHDIRRLTQPEQPVAEDSGGELYAGGRGPEAPGYAWGAASTGDRALRGGDFHCGGARRVLRGRQRRDGQLFAEHAGACAGRARHRGRRQFRERPLGSRPPARRRRNRAGGLSVLAELGHPARHAVPLRMSDIRGRACGSPASVIAFEDWDVVTGYCSSSQAAGASSASQATIFVSAASRVKPGNSWSSG